MKQYLRLMNRIYHKGVDINDDRTGTGTRSLFGPQLSFDLSKGFPLLTTKRLPFRYIIEELLWFISGSTNVNDMGGNSSSIWRPWADDRGNTGPIYGHALEI